MLPPAVRSQARPCACVWLLHETPPHTHTRTYQITNAHTQTDQAPGRPLRLQPRHPHVAAALRGRARGQFPPRAVGPRDGGHGPRDWEVRRPSVKSNASIQLSVGRHCGK